MLFQYGLRCDLGVRGLLEIEKREQTLVRRLGCSDLGYLRRNICIEVFSPLQDQVEYFVQNCDAESFVGTKYFDRLFNPSSITKADK
jgi:hypothetical protein